ncbi:MAG: DUF4143 domain-containing protein [Gemmatimonadetes bacterium]|nr:DUF4143 domain-containing protein [Gemmatimonadota bacterium]
MELYPLTLPEMLTDSWTDAVGESRMVCWLSGEAGDDSIFAGIPQRDEGYARTGPLLRNYLQFGGMPAIVDEVVDDEEKIEWLWNYIQTYLQRDVRDLANLRELDPFVRAQRTLAGMTGQLLNISNLARLAGIAPRTARRFIAYLEISYQVILLQPWFRNLNKRLVKAAKVHFLDPGVQRVLLSRRGEVTGGEFESAVIAEIYKQVRNSRLSVDFYHLRTVDGKEVDLLLELEEGFVPIEIKMVDRVSPTDARHLRGLEEILDKPVLHALVLSNDDRIRELGEGITGLPVGWFLGR